MHRRDRGTPQKLQRKVPVRDGIDRVGGRAIEAEIIRGRLPIDRKTGASECCRPERAFVQPFSPVGKPPAITPEHLDIGHEMVAEGDGLGCLQMGEARHHPIVMRLGTLEQDALQVLQQPVDAIHDVAQP